MQNMILSFPSAFSPVGSQESGTALAFCNGWIVLSLFPSSQQFGGHTGTVSALLSYVSYGDVSRRQVAREMTQCSRAMPALSKNPDRAQQPLRWLTTTLILVPRGLMPSFGLHRYKDST